MENKEDGFRKVRKGKKKSGKGRKKKIWKGRDGDGSEWKGNIRN